MRTQTRIISIFILYSWILCERVINFNRLQKARILYPYQLIRIPLNMAHPPIYIYSYIHARKKFDSIKMINNSALWSCHHHSEKMPPYRKYRVYICLCVAPSRLFSHILNITARSDGIHQRTAPPLNTPAHRSVNEHTHTYVSIS